MPAVIEAYIQWKFGDLAHTSEAVASSATEPETIELAVEVISIHGMFSSMLIKHILNLLRK